MGPRHQSRSIPIFHRELASLPVAWTRCDGVCGIISSSKSIISIRLAFTELNLLLHHCQYVGLRTTSCSLRHTNKLILIAPSSEFFGSLPHTIPRSTVGLVDNTTPSTESAVISAQPVIQCSRPAAFLGSPHVSRSQIWQQPTDSTSAASPPSRISIRSPAELSELGPSTNLFRPSASSSL